MTADAILAATIPSVFPTIMVLVGILMNKNDINQVRSSISELRGEMNGVRGEMNAMRGQFHSDINGLRSDIATLVGISNDLDKRVSRLEDKN